MVVLVYARDISKHRMDKLMGRVNKTETTRILEAKYLNNWEALVRHPVSTADMG